MKPQLLEDIGDSQSPADMRSELPAFRKYSVPRQAIPPLPRSHFGVWRDRDVQTMPIMEQPQAAPGMSEPSLGTVDEKTFTDDRVEDIFAAPPENLFITPLEPESAAPAPSATRSRLATWGSALLVLALVAGGSLWLFNDRKDEASLAVVAGKLGGGPAASVSTSAPQVLPPAVRQAENIPPLVVLEPENTVEREPENVAEVTVPAQDERPTSAQQPVKKPTSTRTRTKTAAVKSEPRPALLKAKNSVGEASASAFSKACSALGYREAQCRKRACVLTKYGLACRG